MPGSVRSDSWSVDAAKSGRRPARGKVVIPIGFACLSQAAALRGRYSASGEAAGAMSPSSGRERHVLQTVGRRLQLGQERPGPDPALLAGTGVRPAPAPGPGRRPHPTGLLGQGEQLQRCRRLGHGGSLVELALPAGRPRHRRRPAGPAGRRAPAPRPRPGSTHPPPRPAAPQVARGQALAPTSN